jgi:hypothetical protein
MSPKAVGELLSNQPLSHIVIYTVQHKRLPLQTNSPTENNPSQRTTKHISTQTAKYANLTSPTAKNISSPPLGEH